MPTQSLSSIAGRSSGVLRPDLAICLLFPRFYEGFVMGKVPLGLAYLAAALKQHGIPVEAYNLNVDDFYSIDFKKFNFIGITMLTPFIQIIRTMTNHIKQINPKLKIILGGPHVTYRCQDVFGQIPLADYIITGEGEHALPNLLLDEKNFGEIPGVYYLNEHGHTVGTPHKPVDIHTLPWPDMAIFDHGALEKRNPYRAIMASRGCPFQCSNCQPILSTIQPFRTRRVQDVIEEMRCKQKHLGLNYFGFVDSEFPIKKNWYREFHQEVKRFDMRFQFHCNGHAGLLNHDIIEIHKDLGINRLAIGVESGVQRVVDTILDKKINLETVKEIFSHAWEMGIRTHAHFMIGIPGETLDEMAQTLEYAMTLPTMSLEFNVLTPWPGTRFWEICQEKNYLTDTDCANFNEKRVSVISTPDFTNHQVMAFRSKVKEQLTRHGWQPAPDGTVYYHQQFKGDIT